jgi:ABC-2 type transport system permease protein
VRELAASRAAWLVLAAAGVLTGHAFTTAIDTYAEMSGTGGGPAALRAGLSPLDGIVSPVLSPLWLIATLLLPFVVIRTIVHERTNGAWTLLIQGPATLAELVTAKVLVLLAAWCCAFLPALVALGLWRGAGNHLDAAETLNVIAGHALFGWLTIGVAAAAAAAASTEAGAAIVTLTFTIGTWALDFMGAARGGAIAELAAYTPTAVLRTFERGLMRLDATLLLVAAGALCILAGACGLDVRLARKTRLARVSLLAVLGAVVVLALGRVHTVADVSENRRNSFSRTNELLLGQIRGPVRIDVNLAAQDPRRADLEMNVLSKLKRLMPSADVRYTGGSGTGMFARPGAGYGEIRIDVAGRTERTRSIAEPIVLGTLYHLAGIPEPAGEEDPYPGYPLVGRPLFVRTLFYVLWPLLILLAFLTVRRPNLRVRS